MSIITDALKKAERERELREKQAAEELSVSSPSQAYEPPSLQTESLNLAESKSIPSVQENQGLSFRAFRSSIWWSKEIFLVGGAILFFLFILFALPHWPQVGSDLSIIWRPLRNQSAFRIGSLGPVVPQGSPPPVPSAPASFEGAVATKFPFVLSGISISGDDRYAVVNGAIVQKGDSIDGAHVKEILDREVVLETRSGEIRLRIPS